MNQTPVENVFNRLDDQTIPFTKPTYIFIALGLVGVLGIALILMLGEMGFWLFVGLLGITLTVMMTVGLMYLGATLWSDGARVGGSLVTKHDLVDAMGDAGRSVAAKQDDTKLIPALLDSINKAEDRGLKVAQLVLSQANRTPAINSDSLNYLDDDDSHA